MKTRLTEREAVRGRAPLRIKPSLKSGEGAKIEQSITIERPPEEIYAFWRQFENLPRFMRHIQSVRESGGNTSHWVARSQRGKTMEWDARLIEDKRGQMISWQSLEGADVDNAGSVWFKPAAGGRSTVVKVSMKYSPPGGKVGVFFSKLFGESAEKQMAEDLSRLKTLLESGQIPSI